jgi:CASC3/Barentsz eIF4AIII binding
MATKTVHRRKNLLASRRRVDDEGEEEGGPDAGLEDDSLSEGSAFGLSDDDDDDGDGSDGDEGDHVSHQKEKSRSINGDGKTQSASPKEESKVLRDLPNGMDTELMKNGLKIEGATSETEVDFENMGKEADAAAPATSAQTQMDMAQESQFERRKREHDEYKKRRDQDPAFVPNRGAFFMHDHRHAGAGANGFRPFGRGGRGRGRGGIGGPFSPAKYVVLSLRNSFAEQNFVS